MSDIKISRDQLYKKVWEFPMIKIAEEYIWSDSGLREQCKKYAISIKRA